MIRCISSSVCARRSPADWNQTQRTAFPSSSVSRFAADLLPSPSGFLNDISYDGYSLSGLNTAIALSNADSVFTWPKTDPGVGPAPALRPEEAPGLFGEVGRRMLKRGNEEDSPVTARARGESMEVDEGARESAGEEGSVKKSRVKMS